MARKAIPKTAVDKQQQKQINSLKRMMPTQREVVNTVNSTVATASAPIIQRLTPVALDDERLTIRGFDMRASCEVDSAGTAGLFYRYLIIIYKCDVSHSAGTPSVTEPTIGDLFNQTTLLNQQTALINPENASRIRVLYDTTYNLQPTLTYQGMRQYRKFFKKPLIHMATNDKAFVHRPFLVKMSSGTVQTGTVEGVVVNVHTVQLP